MEQSVCVGSATAPRTDSRRLLTACRGGRGSGPGWARPWPSSRPGGRKAAAAFAKHHRERVVISDQGRVRLGQALVPTGPIAAERVWDLARTGRTARSTPRRAMSGKVFRRSSQGRGRLDRGPRRGRHPGPVAGRRLPEGKVFVGTGPSGQVIEVTDAQHPASRPDPKVQYIWDLAADPRVSLYAATGPGGQLWKRARDGKWSLLLDSKASHLLSVAVGRRRHGLRRQRRRGADLSGRPGRQGLGRLRRPPGRGRIAPDRTRRCPLRRHGRRGVGRIGGRVVPRRCSRTATESVMARGSRTQVAGIGLVRRLPVRHDLGSGRRAAGPAQVRSAARPPAGRPAPKAVTPGDNAVYRIEPDGVVREVFRAKALIFALAWSEDRLLVGTGPDGQLFEVRDRGAETPPLAKLDTGQVLSLLAEPDGGILLGTGDPGSVVRLSSGFVPQGELVSEVFDTKLLSRFGALSWRADVPAGTSLTVQVQDRQRGRARRHLVGLVGRPDRPLASRAESPPGRFVQYKARLATKDPAHIRRSSRASPSTYRSSNLPPEINRLDVPDVSACGRDREADPAEPADGTCPTRTTTSFITRSRSARTAGRGGSRSPRRRSPRRPMPGTRPRSRRATTGSASRPATGRRTVPTTP